jgi:hypothetical protein
MVEVASNSSNDEYFTNPLDVTWLGSCIKCIHVHS